MILKPIEKTGSLFLGICQILIDGMKILLETLYWIFVAPFQFKLERRKLVDGKAVFEQMVFMGFDSVIIVFFVTFFTGIVLADLPH